MTKGLRLELGELIIGEGEEQKLGFRWSAHRERAERAEILGLGLRLGLGFRV